MRPALHLAIIALALLLSSCAGGRAAQPATATPAAPTPTGGRLSAPSPTQPAPSPVTPQAAPTATPLNSYSRPELPFSQYALSATLDYDRHQLSVEQQINYVNHSGEPLPDLVLLVEPNRYPGGFQLKELAGENGEAITNYTLSGPALRLPLDEPLAPGSSLRLSLAYDLVLPNQQAPYGYTERQTNLGDWYPYLPPFIPGEGWLAREDAYYGEHLAYEMADFEVEVRLVSPYADSGEQLVIAASAWPELEGETYHYRLEAARNFAWTVSHLYQIQEAQAGDIRVTAYSFPNHPAADGPALQATVDALLTFSEVYGPYPHDSLAVVEADFLDGMEFDGLFFLSHAFYDYFTGDVKSNLVIIAAHETAHQWWYGLVGNDQALEPWLDEALCTYSELIFFERVYPDLASWWWDNRITFHNPQGWVDATIYQADGFYPYRDAVYLRGAMFLGELRAQMGDEAFFAFLRDYLNKYAYRQASADDFFALLAEHTSADLDALAAPYFEKR